MTELGRPQRCDVIPSADASAMRCMAANCLLNIYKFVILIDLKNNTYAELSGSVDNYISQSGAQDYLINTFIGTADEADMDRLRVFLSFDELDELVKKGDIIELEYTDRKMGWCRARFIPICCDQAGENSKVLFCCEDINQHKLKEIELEKQLQKAEEKKEELMHDGLTGLFVRSVGENRINKLLAQHIPGTLLITDCDKFKYINDTFGHMTGDEVLVNIAASLSSSSEEGDILVRLGGDEFVLFAPGLCDYSLVEALIRKLFRSVDGIHIPVIPANSLKISVGAVIYKGEKETSFDELYKIADSKLYNSKKRYGNQVTYGEIVC